jgi:glyoxylase I family protein
MLSSSSLDAVVLFVSSLARSVAFYRQTLGLAVDPVEQGPEGAFATARAGAVSLVLIERPARVGESPVLVFTLPGGIDTCASRLAQAGVEIVVPVSHAPDGGLTLDFLDPDGTVLSLYQPAGAPRD